MFLLLSCWILAGIMAVDPARTYYQATNSSLCLHVTKPPPHMSSTWKFGSYVIVSPLNFNPLFKEKVDYHRENMTLCIKKLTKADTGTYTIKIQDETFKETEENHRVNVQDAVPRPVIAMSVLRSNLSAGFCNFTVNCSVWGRWLWSMCDKGGCHPSQKLFSEVNITVSMSNRAVVCSGNNHVSTNHVSENTATMCFRTYGPDNIVVVHTNGLLLISGACACFIFLVFIVSYIVKKLCSKFKPNQLEEQPQYEPRTSTSSSSPSDAAYENIDDINPIQDSRSRPSQKVDTVYCLSMEPIHVPASRGGDDDKGTNVKSTGGATAPQCVGMEEKQPPVQICTVYSELQKPRNLKPQQ
ncbi:uncharacterized protein LOC131456980 [Solea solea]|uniref:uncharacterized protein LOC131456980 n=1 Tax=Solea solea TaxID=90069 RepID=UPI00272AA120|nr:uncharacterized protein LOC131456980 [Solea solea]